MLLSLLLTNLVFIIARLFTIRKSWLTNGIITMLHDHLYGTTFCHDLRVIIEFDRSGMRGSSNATRLLILFDKIHASIQEASSTEYLTYYRSQTSNLRWQKHMKSYYQVIKKKKHLILKHIHWYTRNKSI